MSSNLMDTGTGSGTATFARPVSYVTFAVQTATIGISLDGGAHYLTLTTGVHSFHIGATESITINGTGSWQVIGVVS